jgi:hypothetical protein
MRDCFRADDPTPRHWPAPAEPRDPLGRRRDEQHGPSHLRSPGTRRQHPNRAMPPTALKQTEVAEVAEAEVAEVVAAGPPARLWAHRRRPECPVDSRRTPVDTTSRPRRTPSPPNPQPRGVVSWISSRATRLPLLIRKNAVVIAPSCDDVIESVHGRPDFLTLFPADHRLGKRPAHDPQHHNPRRPASRSLSHGG